MLSMTKEGKVAGTADNYKIIFTYDPLLRGAFRFNLLTEKIDIKKSLGWFRASDALSDVDIQYLMLYLEQSYGIANQKKIEGMIKLVANENRFHPICDYLNALQWDGQERIRYALKHFLGAEVSDFNYELLRLFMLGAITRAFHPGTKFDSMLCLVGGQGAGKSTFFRFLAIKDEWFTDDLRKLDAKDVYEKLQGHWIIEMSEMIATANAKSIEEIKSFMSRQKDNYRTPYTAYTVDHKRQCVFGGTSNNMDFLPQDRTGNRRFLPIKVQVEEAECHILADEAASRAYIEQMWAEAMVIYRTEKPKLRLSDEMAVQLAEHQKIFMPEDTLSTQILNFLDRYKGDMVCVRQLYHEALGHPDCELPKQYESRDIAAIMRNYAADWVYFDNPRHFPAPYYRQKGWERVKKPDNPLCENDGFTKLTEAEAEQIGFPKEWLETEN